MSHSRYRQLLDRGRKAGLNTAELYRALSSRQPLVGDDPTGAADCNGFVAQVLANGQRSYHPTTASAERP
jgi:hypothetical protein